MMNVCASLIGFGAMLSSAARADAAALTPGNLVVVRIGDGAAALSNAATPTFLDEYTPGGTFVQTIALPTAAAGANKILTNSGTATSEGFLNLSTNGQYLVLGGYNATVGTTNVAATTSAAANRVVGRVSLAGAVDTSTAFSDSSYSGSNIRSVASVDGSAFWTGGTAGSGANGGVRYATFGGASSTQLSSTLTNTRVVNISGGQLYTSSASGAFQGVSTVGTGLPTTSGQTTTLLPGFPTATGPQSYDYFFADANTVYVADDRTSTAGGIQKWTLSGGTWSLAYTLNPASGVGCRGLIGKVSGGVTTLYATTTQAAANQIVAVADTGASSAFTVIATTAANTVFRGIRSLPVSCVAPVIDDEPESAVACAFGGPVSFHVHATGTGPFTYQWRQGGLPLSNVDQYSGVDTDTLTIDPVDPGDFGSYDVVVTNACGNDVSASVSLDQDLTDTDSDGEPDCTDGCPNDPDKITPDQCGCGVPDTDTDGDGIADCLDGCPKDPEKTAPGVCGCGHPDVDTDGDGTLDCLDGCPADPKKTSPGACGCGIPDTDTDGDGVADCVDRCPGIPNDLDTDGDGTPDCADGCPADPGKIAPGTCGCGIPDTDTDKDGTPDCNDLCPIDPDKTVPGACGCGVPDTDTDGDGTPDCLDGCPADPDKTAPGQCGCGAPDADADGDGLADCLDGCPEDPNKTSPGACGCGIPDTDTDTDGTPDCLDGCPEDPLKIAPGVCGCGVADTDSDGDGVADCVDQCPDFPDEVDCNDNGVADGCDIKNGTSLDANGNGIPDECEPDTCPWDISPVFGVIDIDDLFTVINHWGETGGVADIDHNNIVDVDDLFLIINHWGACP